MIYKRSTHYATVLYERVPRRHLIPQHSAVDMFRLRYLWRLGASYERTSG